MRIKTQSIIGFVFLIMLISSCTRQDNYISTTTTKTGNTVMYRYEIQSMSHAYMQFFEVTMRLSYTDTYSADSFTYINYKKIHQTKYDNLTDIEIESKNNKTFNFIVNRAGRYPIAFPENSKSHGSKITNEKVRACHSEFNELMRLEYSLPESEFPDAKYIRVIGVRNYTEVENLEYDLDYFFNTGHNLFHIYRDNFSCDFEWKVKYKEK